MGHYHVAQCDKRDCSSPKVTSADTATANAYQAANSEVSLDMEISYTGEPDIDLEHLIEPV